MNSFFNIVEKKNKTKIYYLLDLLLIEWFIKRLVLFKPVGGIDVLRADVKLVIIHPIKISNTLILLLNIINTTRCFCFIFTKNNLKKKKNYKIKLTYFLKT